MRALAAACLLFATDGDSLHLCGERIRLETHDTAEHYPRAKCPQEAELARRAQNRLNSLIAQHRRKGTLVLVYRLRRNGWPARDKYRRYLATLYVGGEDVGAVLVKEGLARPYRGGKRRSWC